MPLIIEYNGSEVWVAEKWGTPLKFKKLACRIEEINLKHAHLIVVVSKVLKDELVSRGIEEDRIVYYPNCVDPVVYNMNRYPIEKRDSLRKYLGIQKDSTLCTFVGTFGPWHGVELLAIAVKQIIAQEAEWVKKHKVQFMLIGDGQLMPQVRHILINSMDYVFLTGIVPQHETPAYLAISDVLLSPHVPNPDGSRFFGSPTKLFEYMAMGKSIIASDLDQIGDIFQSSLRAESLPVKSPNDYDEMVGILFQPGDIDGFIRSIKFLVENPSWRKVLGDNARKEILSKYTWNIHVAQILAALCKLDTKNK